MVLKGDCLTCDRLATCSETSVERVRSGYTCPLFTPTPEPVFLARHQMITQYGEVTAIGAMMDRPPEDETQNERGEEDDGTEL